MVVSPQGQKAPDILSDPGSIPGTSTIKRWFLLTGVTRFRRWS